MLLLPGDTHKKRGERERERFKSFCSRHWGVESGAWGAGGGFGSSD